MSTARRSPAIHRTLVRALAVALAASAIGEGVDASTQETRAAAHRPGVDPSPTGGLFILTNCNDSGSGSLRAAMAIATNNSTVDFDQLTCSTITLTTGALTDPNVDSLKLLATPLVVAGRPVPAVTIDANGASRVIDHQSGGELELRGLALLNGRANDGKGGCVYSAGHVTATAVTVSGCVAAAPGAGNALGGGIASNDAVELHFSTISGNSARADGGGYAYGGGVFTPYGMYSAYSTIANNLTTGVGYGGGISVRGYTLLKSTLVSGNTAAYGAGLALFGASVGLGDLQIINSTITQNHATGFAAGVESSGPLMVFGSTIAGNAGDHATDAGGIVIEGANILQLTSTIVATNTQGGIAHDISGASSIIGSANIVGVSTVAPPVGTILTNPMLAPLADNGGQTSTMRLLSGSPAINAGSNPLNTLCDQRAGAYAPSGGFLTRYPRALGNAPDIGAFETGSGDALFRDGFEIPAVPLICYSGDM